jgi:hypothetical protein
MKNQKKISALSFGLLLVTSLLYVGCSKERIQTRSLNQYNSPNSYLDSKKEQEQEFVITSDSGGTIVGNQGSKLYGSRHCFMFPNGDSVALPYSIKLVELYGAKQMIYYQMPTVAGGTILKTDGEIRYRAFKNGTELVLKPDPCMAAIEMPNAAPQAGMRVFYGFNSGGHPDWTDNPSALGVTTSLSGNFTTPSYGYAAPIARLGWINCGQLAGSASNSTLTFASTVDDLTNVAIFVYIPATKTVMQVYNLASSSIPNGSAVKIVCIGVDAANTLYSYSQNLTVTANTQIDVTMAATTDPALTALLTGL